MHSTETPAVPAVEYEWIGGQCPVQAEGTVDGKRSYFRARDRHWALEIGAESDPETFWRIKRTFGPKWTAGYMSEATARRFIESAVKLWHTERVANKLS